MFTSCNMNKSKYMPEKYFSRGAELSMAENIYYGNKSEIKEMVNNGRVDINTPGNMDLPTLCMPYIYKSMIWQNSY